MGRHAWRPTTHFFLIASQIFSKRPFKCGEHNQQHENPFEIDECIIASLRNELPFLLLPFAILF